MATNAFKCSKCKKYTKHVQISFREFSSLCPGRGTGHHIFAAISDFTGFTKTIVNGLGGLRYYKCCECGEASARNLDGSEAISSE